MRVRRSRSRQRGAAALEFALVAPVIILMILGMVDLGMVMNAQAVVANAARDGARVASLNQNTTAVKTAVWTTASGLNNAVKDVNPSVTVQCLLADAVTPCTGSGYDAISPKPANSVVKVTVTYTYTWITPLPSWIGRGSAQTIAKVSYMRIEGTK